MLHKKKSLPLEKSDNTYENLLNEIRKAIYTLHWTKEITKKVYNNIMNAIKLQYKMNTRFTNSENNKTSDPLRLLLSLSDKINLKRVNKGVIIKS